MARMSERELRKLQERRIGKGASPLNIASQIGGAAKGQRSKAEERMEDLLEEWAIPDPILEHRFSKDRKWRFDFAWKGRKNVAIEVEGIQFDAQRAGRHQRGDGFARDCEKYNMAALMGWIVLRVPSTWLAKQDLHEAELDVVRKALDRWVG